ncbi:MAG: alpha/beta fold hydrolase, partial [Nannocystaceae bacterium]|nr:alpha/beta fold hydrolase [Nannocystaceae bacterium]
MNERASELSTDVTLLARDALPLAGTVYGSPSARKVAVINSATAVPRRFYRHFAGALVEAGYRVVTYDYRGIGGSRPRQLRGFSAKMRDWGLQDMAGVLDWVRTEHDDARILLVGHSVGGQVAGMLDNVEGIEGMVTFSAQ